MIRQTKQSEINLQVNFKFFTSTLLKQPFVSTKGSHLAMIFFDKKPHTESYCDLGIFFLSIFL